MRASLHPLLQGSPHSPTPYPLTHDWPGGKKSRLYRFVATFGICVTIIVLNSALNVLQLAFVSCLP